MDIEKFKKLPVLGILRGVELDIIDEIIDVVIASGLRTLEITMNTPGAPQLLRRMVKKSHDCLMIGAGTVLTLEDLHTAIDSGATFIVSPVLIDEVVKFCIKNRIPVFPGALTPHEIYNAHCAGATMVKVFPLKFFGPSYIKEIKAPLQDIEILACGGVSAENIGEFFLSGTSAVAFGSSIFKEEWLKNRRFSLIKDSIQTLIKEYNSLKN
ncbi:MAG: bifunctional 4-hydroxy-2-oxoglutarate aldolase/2-dehydro-3-deoxy-phosphogluconate aldolase [Candidatus Saelkia tenebricola]|nr:bifunctional 4-hydroxy-2-oxoglutarate aldolase/2-dehydro-3-deoxy-phosphogluconate aldolase [Candidatus Saelkia tenebricola]